MKGSNENQRDAIRNALLRNVGHQQQGLAEVQQRINRDSTVYDEFLERSHVTSLEENSNANDPLNSPQINPIPNLLLQDVKEYCPACGNLEWQGLHIRCSGVQSGEIEFEGRITDITHKYIPGLVRDAEKKLENFNVELQLMRSSGMEQKGKLMRESNDEKQQQRRLRLPN